jgi:hypothetical protein
MSGLWGLGQPRPWCSQGAASHGLGTASRNQGAASHSLATARARPAATRVQPVGAVARPWRGTTGRGSAEHDRSWPVVKPSTKMLNAVEKHKMLCSIVVKSFS